MRHTPAKPSGIPSTKLFHTITALIPPPIVRIPHTPTVRLGIFAYLTAPLSNLRSSSILPA